MLCDADEKQKTYIAQEKDYLAQTLIELILDHKYKPIFSGAFLFSFVCLLFISG